jgi:hypothetical protein
VMLQDGALNARVSRRWNHVLPMESSLTQTFADNPGVNAESLQRM